MSTNGSIALTLDRTGASPIVTDGSMTIELYRRGYPERPSDRYNLTIPAVIERIHGEFREAGATLLQSNTVHANRYALEVSMLSARVTEINRKGVWLARTAAGSTAHVAGVIGPTGRLMKPLGTIGSQRDPCVFSRTSAGTAGRGLRSGHAQVVHRPR